MESKDRVDEQKNSGLPEELLDDLLSELLQRQAELTRTINVELEELHTDDAERFHPADMDDLGGDANDEETNYRLLEIESAELGQVDWALERLKVGRYGTCEECSQPIGVERLRALVFATMCIDCKRAQEQNDMAA